jgi:hypothetical protein
LSINRQVWNDMDVVLPQNQSTEIDNNQKIIGNNSTPLNAHYNSPVVERVLDSCKNSFQGRTMGLSVQNRVSSTEFSFVSLVLL